MEYKLNLIKNKVTNFYIIVPKCTSYFSSTLKLFLREELQCNSETPKYW